MARLKSRQMFVPGGFKFYQPEIRWSSPPNASFDTIVNNLIGARRANPAYQVKYGWSLDYDSVANEVDAFNARICEQMGWNNYIIGGPEPPGPKSVPPPQSSLQKLRNVAAGANTLVDWLKSGAEAVAPDLSARRAAVCATCPENGRGDWTRWFTVPVSEAIRREVSKRSAMNLSTPSDDQLGVCQVCLCPLKLKIHMKIEDIKPRLAEDVRSLLPDHCWIKKEMAA